jgi:prepilin-type N-terminal cleavage/methylation domain-containing protein
MKKGFTLIEIMVTLSILLILSVSFLTLGRAGIKLSAAAFERFTAINTCQSKMEALLSLPFSDLLLENGKSFDSGRGLVKVLKLSPDLAELSIEHITSKDKPKLILHTLRSAY